MKVVFSHWVSFFIWIMNIYTISMILIMGMQMNNAGSFHSQVIHRLESSYYSSEVIKQCEVKAKELGYSLKIEEETIYQDRKDIKVSLTYKIHIPLLMINRSETLVGYAR